MVLCKTDSAIDSSFCVRGGVKLMLLISGLIGVLIQIQSIEKDREKQGEEQEKDNLK